MNFNNYYPQTPTMVEQVASITSNQRLQALAAEHKKVIQKVAWEDTARNKNSSWGPNICDFTLCAKLDRDGKPTKANGISMPLLRNPNFADQTLDQDYRSFPLLVGNQTTSTLTPTTIRDYLENFTTYTDSNKETKSLWLERDEKILTSTQACFLPLGKDGRVAFNGKLFNYQFDKEDPAILVVLASASGTSAQVITSYNQELYFNDKGQAADFLAERLTQFREEEAKRTGQAVRTGAMNQDERSKNVIFMFQVPLKQTKPKKHGQGFGYGGSVQCMSIGQPLNAYFGDDDDCIEEGFEACSDSSGLECCAMSLSSNSRRPDQGDRHSSASRRQTRGMEDAIVSTSETHGPFAGIGGRTLIRDERFPIRCTVQYYKVTDTDEIDAETIAGVARQLDKAYDTVGAELKGSLVGTRSADSQEKTTRITEPDLQPKQMQPNYGTFNVAAF